MTPRKLVSLVALLCGVIALIGWGAARLQAIGSSDIENRASGAPESAPGATPTSSGDGGVLDAPESALIAPAGTAMAEPEPPETTPALTVCSAERPVLQALLLEPHPVPQPETRLQPVSLSTSMDLKENPEPVGRPIESPDQCLAAETCIDEYLWSLYERAPKIDTNKVTEKIKTTLPKKKGKARTVIKTVIKYVVGDFTWKDPSAARRANMTLKDYVIGGLDRAFRLKLYRALRAMENADLMPGITSAFRDDYRQSIANGNKAASDSSYHGGSRRGGYGHALAVDLVSVKGETRMERYASSERLWQWIDAHEQQIGIGRPYLDKDPPHVAPVDGREYADKRGRAKTQLAGLKKPSASPNLK